MKSQFEKQGATITSFENGSQLIGAIEENQSPEWLAIILDHSMPVMTGLEALTMINERWSGQFHVPIFMHSTEDSLIGNFKSAGARGYVTKRPGAHKVLLPQLKQLKNGALPDGFSIK